MCPYNLSQPMKPQIKSLKDTPYFWVDNKVKMVQAIEQMNI
jgi:hypothetical protein